MQHDFIGPHRADSTVDFLELALGTPLDLWLGEEGETGEERAARLAAARDILADDPTLFDRTTALAAETIGRTRPELLALAPVPRPIARPRRRTTSKRRAA
ncbi:hypothetical protein SAMN05216223_107256 [Actinacidiphila yanglinensis]|uniref:Uncharacterized protein n=1 Tax=Actinacidiphila yanglinensis TaxID=310779 RepID=A0A1H6BUL4_9ACTN|nr:hypothetical protein [Actinacidiphila yanglinensis]SEG64398.1 hypothetical protein SAMN05216223_107256 [Actinacidiphila yanglinensis]